MYLQNPTRKQKNITFFFLLQIKDSDSNPILEDSLEPNKKAASNTKCFHLSVAFKILGFYYFHL